MEKDTSVENILHIEGNLSNQFAMKFLCAYTFYTFNAHAHTFLRIIRISEQEFFGEVYFSS